MNTKKLTVSNDTTSDSFQIRDKIRKKKQQQQQRQTYLPVEHLIYSSAFQL